MEWHFNNDAPIYAQLVEQITLGIVTAVYLPGQRLPAVRELAVEAGVNPNTMQRALSELERNGLVFSQRTTGRFVTEDEKMIEEAKRGLAEERISAFLRGMSQLGFSNDEIVSLVQAAQNKEEREDGCNS